MLLKAYVLARWARLTIRRYGFLALFTTYRPRRAKIGRGVVRDTGLHGSVTGWNLTTGEIVAMCEKERQGADR